MHDFDKEFDLKLRSMLDGVEEEVPQRVWDGVSSRIGRRHAPVAWMRWAGASLAAAAAVALAVVLSGTFKGSPDSLVPQESLVAAVQTPSYEVEQAVVEDEPQMEVPQTVSSASTRRSSSRTKTETLHVAESAQASVPDQETAVAQDQKQESSASTKPSQKKSTKGQAWDDPFARMAYEDAHTRSSIKVKSVGFGGLLGTNDGAKPGSHGAGMMGVSGKIPSKVITEDGESRYGVPASLGLGVRFDINDRWSLGTGLSFSQLSRSFEGIYKDGLSSDSELSLVGVRGNIKNSVQYIGIPVNLYCNVISNDVFDFYTFAGGSVEKCVSNKFRVPVKGKTVTAEGDYKGLQYSAAVGLGVQFNIADNFGLYIDPSARYWMGKDQPKSIRTQQPFMFNIELGLRFEL